MQGKKWSYFLRADVFFNIIILSGKKVPFSTLLNPHLYYPTVKMCLLLYRKLHYCQSDISFQYNNTFGCQLQNRHRVIYSAFSLELDVILCSFIDFQVMFIE